MNWMKDEVEELKILYPKSKINELETIYQKDATIKNLTNIFKEYINSK
jgi:hypothetical protein